MGPSHRSGYDRTVRRIRALSCGALRIDLEVALRCQETVVKEMAKELKLAWKTVKSREKEYMREQRQRTGTPGPQAIGSDEMSSKKGPTSRLVAALW